MKPHSALVKIIYAGVNASDVSPFICIFNFFYFELNLLTFEKCY
jgi:hypothetical protein